MPSCCFLTHTCSEQGLISCLPDQGPRVKGNNGSSQGLTCLPAFCRQYQSTHIKPPPTTQWLSNIWSRWKKNCDLGAPCCPESAIASTSKTVLVSHNRQLYTNSSLGKRGQTSSSQHSALQGHQQIPWVLEGQGVETRILALARTEMRGTQDRQAWPTHRVMNVGAKGRSRWRQD